MFQPAGKVRRTRQALGTPRRGALDIRNPDAKYRCKDPIIAPHCVEIPLDRTGISPHARGYASLAECEYGCRGLVPLSLVATEIAPFMLQSPQYADALPATAPQTPEELEMASHGLGGNAGGVGAANEYAQGEGVAAQVGHRAAFRAPLEAALERAAERMEGLLAKLATVEETQPEGGALAAYAALLPEFLARARAPGLNAQLECSALATLTHRALLETRTPEDLLHSTAEAHVFLTPPAPQLAYRVMYVDPASGDDALSWMVQQPWVADPVSDPENLPVAFSRGPRGGGCFQRADPAAALLENATQSPTQLPGYIDTTARSDGPALRARVLREMLSRWSAEALARVPPDRLERAVGALVQAGPAQESLAVILRLVGTGTVQRCDASFVQVVWRNLPEDDPDGAQLLAEGTQDAVFPASCLREPGYGAARATRLGQERGLRRPAAIRALSDLGLSVRGRLVVLVPEAEAWSARDRLSETFGQEQVFDDPEAPEAPRPETEALRPANTFAEGTMGERPSWLPGDVALVFDVARANLEDLLRLSPDDWTRLFDLVGLEPTAAGANADGSVLYLVLSARSPASLR